MITISLEFGVSNFNNELFLQKNDRENHIAIKIQVCKPRVAYKRVALSPSTSHIRLVFGSRIFSPELNQSFLDRIRRCLRQYILVNERYAIPCMEDKLTHAILLVLSVGFLTGNFAGKEPVSSTGCGSS